MLQKGKDECLSFNHLLPLLPSYRNQSINLLYKSICKPTCKEERGKIAQ